MIDAVRRHIIKVHTNNEAESSVVECTICNRHLKKESLNAHIARIHQDKYSVVEQVCEFCKKKLKDVNNLKIHIRTIHGNVKNFTCNLCSKPFATQRQLNVHISCIHSKGNWNGEH